MAKKIRISSAESKNLRSALQAAKYSSPSILARVLLEAFIFEDGNINSDWFVREKVCTKGSFTKMRDRIIKDQWLYFREDSKRYFPGVRLKPHLDIIKESKAATLSDIEAMGAKKADRSDLDDLDNRKADKTELEITKLRLLKTEKNIRQIAEAIRDLQEAMSPPDTAAKKKLREEKAQKIAALSKN